MRQRGRSGRQKRERACVERERYYVGPCFGIVCVKAYVIIRVPLEAPRPRLRLTLNRTHQDARHGFATPRRKGQIYKLYLQPHSLTRLSLHQSNKTTYARSRQQRYSIDEPENAEQSPDCACPGVSQPCFWLKRSKAHRQNTI